MPKYEELISIDAFKDVAAVRKLPLTWEFGEVIGFAVVNNDGTAEITVTDERVASIIMQGETRSLSMGHSQVI